MRGGRGRKRVRGGKREEGGERREEGGRGERERGGEGEQPLINGEKWGNIQPSMNGSWVRRGE